jgi:hypothetical protein
MSAKRYVISALEHGPINSIKIIGSLMKRKYLRVRSDGHFMQVAGVRRELLGERLLNKSENKVLYGYFKGLKLESNLWGARDVASIILGQYEKEILDFIMKIPSSFSYFVDIGAADGIYAVGLLKNQKFKRVICFESNLRSQESIKINADNNQVTSQISIFGEAKIDFLNTITLETELQLSKTVFLFDIEGGEYDLLTTENLMRMATSFVIVEIHKNVQNYETKYKELIRKVAPFFDYKIIREGERGSTEFSEISHWPDEDRNIIFSEGRRYAMEWLALSPRKDINTKESNLVSK